MKLKNSSTAQYGFGWRITKSDSSHRMFEHGGAWRGFASYIARYPDDHLRVAVLCNRAGASASYIGKQLAGFYDSQLAPSSHSAIKLDAATLQSYAGKYRLDDRLTIELVVAGDRLQTT